MKSYKNLFEEVVDRALHGDADAMFSLGLAYETGNGVATKQCLSAAKYWYVTAKKHIQDSDSPLAKDVNQHLAGINSVPVLQRSNQGLGVNSAYDRQIIVDCIGTDINGAPFFSAAINLSKKWNLNHTEPCQLLRGDDLFQTSTILDPDISNMSTRIYIVAHGAPGEDYVYKDEQGKQKIHFNQLAEALIKHIGDNNVTINLVSCNAGRGNKENEADSFAAKLHLAIYNKTHRDVPVVARTSIVSIDFGATAGRARKETLDLNKQAKPYDQLAETDFVHHQKKSKVGFRIQDGKQVIFDAYTHASLQNDKWKTKVMSELEKAKDKTLNVNKKQFIQEWITSFNDMNPKDIYLMMKKELSTSNSPIKHVGSDIRGFFKIMSDSESTILGLVEAGSLLFEKPMRANIQPQVHRRR